MDILRIINTFLLAGILAMLILIFLGLRQPISLREPVAIEGWGFESPGQALARHGRGQEARSVPVTIVND